MTTPEADEPARTAPTEAHSQQPSPPPLESPSAESEPSPFHEGETPEAAPPEPTPPPMVADATAPISVLAPPRPTIPAAVAPIAAEREVTYVPLAVTIGDGFKFGCGFFLAMVLALLVGFVLVAALFVLTGLSGVALPIGR